MKAVAGANALTRAWVRRLPDQGTVVSGPGAWPLLAFLADAADGPARTELETALGVPADRAAAHGRELLSIITGSADAGAALGIWARRTVELRKEWLAEVPAGAVEALTGDLGLDKARLDGWAAEHTRGMIERMPVQLDTGTLMVLASALIVRTRWERPFDGWPTEAGPGAWAGRRVHLLTRGRGPVEDLEVLDTADGPVTAVTVRGEQDVDVRLFLGAGEPRRAVAAALEPGLGTLEREAGPGVRVEETRSRTPEDLLDLRTVRFEVRAEHDLTELPEVFGIGAAGNASRGHFPGMSATPLAIQQAKQNAVARFDEAGFEAAAVTAVAMRAGSAYVPPPHVVRIYQVSFDRPFGFAAVHRPTGLVLFAGWITEAPEA